MARWFLFPFFIFRLSCHIIVFLLTLGLISALPFTASFFLIVAVCAYLTLLFYPKQHLVVVTPALPSLPPPPELSLTSVPQLKIQNAAEKLNHAKIQWQAYLSLQPTHRDLLINLGLAEYYAKNWEAYEKLTNQARRVDPNNEIFVQNQK